MHQALYDRILSVARAEDITYYSEVAPLAGLDMHFEEDRDQISLLLREIALHEHEHQRPLLTAVVIHYDDNQPGKGFFTLSRELGLFRTGRPYMFFQQELRRVHDYWRNR